MRLHRRLVRTTTAGTKLYRHDLAIPAAALKELGWTAKTELRIDIKGDTLVIRRDG